MGRIAHPRLRIGTGQPRGMPREAARRGSREPCRRRKSVWRATSSFTLSCSCCSFSSTSNDAPTCTQPGAVSCTPHAGLSGGTVPKTPASLLEPNKMWQGLARAPLANFRLSLSSALQTLSRAAPIRSSTWVWGDPATLEALSHSGALREIIQLISVHYTKPNLTTATDHLWAACAYAVLHQLLYLWHLQRSLLAS